MSETFIQRIKWAVIYWLARHLSDCKTMTPLIGASLDRRTSLNEKISMRLHLITCDYCKRYLKHIAFLKRAAHAHGASAPNNNKFSSGLSLESKTRIKDLLKQKLGLPTVE